MDEKCGRTSSCSGKCANEECAKRYRWALGIVATLTANGKRKRGLFYRDAIRSSGTRQPGSSPRCQFTFPVYMQVAESSDALMLSFKCA